MALGPPPGDRLPASIVGLEHEYSLSVSGTRLDFRDVIHGLVIPGWRLDPGDLNAYRCPSGLVITCDAEDAEVVSPPLAVQPGFAGEVAAWAEHGRAELLRLLPAGVTVTPFSTHISASMPDDLVAAACDLFARTFAPALVLLLGGADSHGVFVRPRPGRLEVCGEHAMGGRLAAATALVAGGARACAGALLGGGSDARLLPPILAVDLRPARGRHGLFVGRHLAFGHDLSAAAGGTPLPLRNGGEMAVQEHLLLAWAAARSALGADSGEGDFRDGDAIVSGSGAVPDVVPPRWPVPVTPSPFGNLAVRHRPGFEAAPEAATWDFTVFRLSGSTRSAFACLPGSQLPAFLERLDAGSLDDLLSGFLGADPAGRVLVARDETAEAGLWDDAVIGPDLLPYERSATDVDSALVLPAPGPIGVAAHPVPQAYVRRGKAATLAVPPDPIASSPISVATTTAAPTALPFVPPPAVSPPADPLPLPPALPAERPPRRRRRVGILVGAVLALLVGVGAAMAGLFAGGSRTDVDILTSPASPAVSSTVIAGPSTTGLETPSTTAPPETTTVPPVAPAVDSTAVTTPAPTTRPTTAASVAPTGPAPVATTVQATTTVPVTTTVQTTTTSTTVPTPTQLVVAVTSGVLSCGFQPGSASAVQGSIVRFRNDTSGGIRVSVAPPAGATTVVNLDAGGTSGVYPLAAPGSYAVTCTPGGDSLVGRMTVTVTAA